MKIRLMLSLSLVVTLILGSCASSNEVTGGGFLQKRKYTNGVYFKNNGNLKGASAKNEDEELDIFKSEERKSKKYITSTTAVSENTNEIEVMFAEENVEPTTELESSHVLSDAVETDESAGTISASNTTSEEAKSTEARVEEKQIATKNNSKKKNSKAPAGDVELILLVILALIIPPLAVFLYEGATQRFWIDLILAILGFGVGFWLLGGLGWVCALVSVIYALLIVLEVI